MSDDEEEEETIDGLSSSEEKQSAFPAKATSIDTLSIDTAE